MLKDIDARISTNQTIILSNYFDLNSLWLDKDHVLIEERRIIATNKKKSITIYYVLQYMETLIYRVNRWLTYVKYSW